MIQEINVIPELNYWFRRELANAPVYDTYHKIPVEVSEDWREPRSVIELLFNETFDPGSLTSSSSSNNIEDENDKPYIYSYRRVNLLHINDKALLQRIQPYRWWANVYAANSMKFIDMFDMQGSNVDPGAYPRNETILPLDVPEDERSPYITYENWNGSTGNYPLWQDGESLDIPPEPIPPIIVPTHIFEFSDSTFEMLDKLWFYKTGCEFVHINDIDYDDLDEALGRLIYIYLDAFLNDSYTHYDSDQSLSTGSDMLTSLYEKYVLDMIYLLRQKMYGVIWKDTVIVNDRMRKIEENYFIILKKIVDRRRVTEEEIANSEFIITGDTLPWDRRDFTFYKDGDILEQDQDFTITVNVDDPYNVYVKVLMLRDDFVFDEVIEFIWSYADPYSALAGSDN